MRHVTPGMIEHADDEVTAHLETCARCRATVTSDVDLDAVRHRLLDEIAADAVTAPAGDTRTPSGRGPWPWLVAGAAVAVAAAVLVPVVWDSALEDGEPETASATTVAGTPPVEVTAPDVPSQPFVVGELASLDLPRSEAAVTAAEIAAVVRADRALGLDLLRMNAGDGNMMVSPYSVATALSMLYPGARGRTAEEIAEVMHLEVDDATLHEVRNAIDTALSETPPTRPVPPEDIDEVEPGLPEDTRVPFAIRPVNSAWGQGGYPFLDDYLAVLATHYGAGLRLVDFVGDPEGATDTINDWVADATEDRIEDLIPPRAIDEMTRLVLVNAIWFKANWAQKFDPVQTAPGPFTLADGNPVERTFMHGTFKTDYIETDTYQAVRLHFAGDAAMVVVLPRTGSPLDLAETLDPDDLDIDWGYADVDLALPRFEFESDLPLATTLKTLGMPTAFVPPRTGTDAEADLTGITASRELYLSDALHKTFIAVDENGTEAAAATALIFNETSAGPEPVRLTVDRPFLFWIEHTPTEELLFLGQVTDPTDG